MDEIFAKLIELIGLTNQFPDIGNDRGFRYYIYKLIQSQASSDDGAFYKEFKCSICISLFDNPVSLPCGHTFCRNCITQSYARSRICPNCRTTITSNPATIETNVCINEICNRLKPL